jgi:hypothetical protein
MKIRSRQGLFVSLLLIILILFSSCKFAADLKSAHDEPELIAQMSDDIIDCFTKKDKAKLKGLFCEQVRNQPGFDQEIADAIAYFDCYVYLTAEIKRSSSGGTHYDHGDLLNKYLTPSIPYIAILAGSPNDSASRYFSINYYWQVVSEIDDSYVGLQYIDIELLNIDSMTLGEYVGGMG